MRRVSDLFERILDRDNLRAAVHRALRGKRDRPSVRRFLADLDGELTALAREVRAGTFPLGRIHQFVIHDPKERIISAPCFAERVLHHAILGVCEPHFERWLIADTFACRKGKGRLACLERARCFAGRFEHFLKMDVRRYFDSISHDRLLDGLARRFKDRPLLALFERIIRSYRGGLGKGLPIGSLTSQHLANFYLGAFDRQVKEVLRIRGYVRYMDDLALWGDPGQIREARSACTAFLGERLGLEVKPWPYQNATRHGMDFLGCRVFPTHLTLSRSSRRRFRRALVRLEAAFEAGTLDERQLQQRATALVAWTRTNGLHAWRFRQAVLGSLTASGRRARTG